MNVTLPSPLCFGDNNILSASFSLQSMPHTLFKFDWNIEVRVWKRWPGVQCCSFEGKPRWEPAFVGFPVSLENSSQQILRRQPKYKWLEKTLKYRMHKMNIRKIKRSKSSRCRLVFFVYVCGLSHRHLGLPKPLEIYFQVTFYLSWYLCVWIRLILYSCLSFKTPPLPLRLTTFPISRKTESFQLFNEWMMVFNEAFLTSHFSWRLAFDCQKYKGRQTDLEDFNQQREHHGIAKWWINFIYMVNLYF